jgi:hypothetical protein
MRSVQGNSQSYALRRLRPAPRDRPAAPHLAARYRRRSNLTNLYAREYVSDGRSLQRMIDGKSWRPARDRGTAVPPRSALHASLSRPKRPCITSPPPSRAAATTAASAPKVRRFHLITQPIPPAPSPVQPAAQNSHHEKGTPEPQAGCGGNDRYPDTPPPADGHYLSGRKRETMSANQCRVNHARRPFALHSGHGEEFGCRIIGTHRGGKPPDAGPLAERARVRRAGSAVRCRSHSMARRCCPSR